MKNSKLGTLSAMILGYLLIGNYDAYEQNAIGTWFMLLGQVLETNSAFLQIGNNNVNKSNLMNMLSNCDTVEIEEVLEYILNIIKSTKN